MKNEENVETVKNGKERADRGDREGWDEELGGGGSVVFFCFLILRCSYIFTLEH